MCRSRAVIRGVLGLLAAALLGAAVASPAAAQLTKRSLDDLEGVGVTEHLGAQIPLDLPFIDSDGSRVTLGDFFDGTRPVILTMNYSDCPKLCSIQLNALVDAMKNMPWDLGKEYRVLTVSIDPHETHDRAYLTRRKYLKDYDRPGTAGGCHFVTSRNERDIKRLAEVIGFGYRYIPETKLYNHVAVLMICSPEGTVSRYLGTIPYNPQTLRLSLAEAAEGKVGSAMDQFLLYCFHYDSSTGRYGPAAFRIMRIGGVLTVLLLGGMMSIYWLREKRKNTKTRCETD